MITAAHANSAFNAAKDCAADGWHVLPLHGVDTNNACACGDPECHSPGKHPIISGGLKNATNDPDQIAEWFTRWPDANVGIRTGAVSGIVVLDIDVKGGGFESLDALTKEFGPLPQAVQAVTGSGGRHIYFMHPGETLGNRTAIRPGIDFRGDQGYVVAPGSTHASGGSYTWVEGCSPQEVEPAPMPAWLLELVKPPRSGLKSAVNAPLAPKQLSGTPRVADASRPELLNAAKRYLHKVPNAEEGERNQSAFTLAGHLAAFTMKDTGETLTHEDVFELVGTWNEQNEPPLDAGELHQAVQSALTNGTPRPPKPVAPDKDDGDDVTEDADESVATQLVRLAEENAELFHVPGVGGECYATVTTNKGCETLGIARWGFRSWLLLQYRRKYDRVPGEQALREATAMITSIAEHDREAHPVSHRVGEHDGAVWLDLRDDEHHVVRVDALGWQVMTDSPVRFLRCKGTHALPTPESGGSIDLLRKYVNVTNEDDWALYLAWLMSTFLVGGPYPCLIVNGEQGSAKTTLTRTTLALTDPGLGKLRAAPAGERDLMIRAANTHVVAYDNISTIQPWFSNALCRLATGGGFGTRMLYANDEELVLDLKRPVILNGIEEFATASDLLDRSIMLQLRAIPESQRREERLIEAEFEHDRPLILGVLLDAVSTALRRRDQVVLGESPRMADFARWATAAEPALGLEDGSVVRAMMQRREDADQITLESDIVGPYLVKLLKSTPNWTGTATQLLEALSRQGYGLTAGQTDPTRRSRYWPQSARALGAHLDRLRPVLRRLGYDFTRELVADRTRTRLIVFTHRGDNAATATTDPSSC